MKKVYIHGDVTLVEVDEIPATAKKVNPEERGIVLAEGEVTGHYHAILPTVGELYKEGDVMYLDITTSPDKIFHQEHGAFKNLDGTETKIKPEKYKIIFPQEYDHLEKLTRRVRD